MLLIKVYKEETMISIEHLTKCYGDFKAVDDLSFEIEEGHVYGFLGPNGAGKSTTMNIMTGCLSATEGVVLIDGYDIFEQPQKAKKLIGYLPEQPPLYMNESPEEYLRFVGEAKGLRGTELTMQIKEVIAQTGLEAVRKRRIGVLSKGYKQRVGIAQAILGDPKIIILDEPTIGLDPIQMIEIRDLIRELGKTHTVILSSHILSEVQTICDKILMIAHGKLVAFDTPEMLEKQLVAPGKIVVAADAEADVLKDVLSKADYVMEVEEFQGDEFATMQVKTEPDHIYDAARSIFGLCVENQIVLLEMSLKKATLETVFLELADTGNSDEECDEEFGEEKYEEREEEDV